jgi:hypothetical protein
MELIKVNNFPVYKDLEPFKEYNFDTVLEIHENILLMLNAIIGYLEGKEHELSFHIVKKNIGLNIDNFISSFSFDITVIREKINLFVTYIEFFHKLHTKQLQRFSNKIQLMYSHVNKDIRFDETIDINDNKKDDSGSERREKSPRKNIIVENSSDTDNDINSLNSPFNNDEKFVFKKSNNNSIDFENETQQKIDEAFSNIESKCDLLLNSNLTNIDTVPGITIELIEEEPVSQESVSQESVSQESVLQESVLQESVLQESVLQESVLQEEPISLDAVSQEESISLDTVSQEENIIIEAQ